MLIFSIWLDFPPVIQLTANIGIGNGLAQFRRQAFIWINLATVTYYKLKWCCVVFLLDMAASSIVRLSSLPFWPYWLAIIPTFLFTLDLFSFSIIYHLNKHKNFMTNVIDNYGGQYDIVDIVMGNKEEGMKIDLRKHLCGMFYFRQTKCYFPIEFITPLYCHRDGMTICKINPNSRWNSVFFRCMWYRKFVSKLCLLVRQATHYSKRRFFGLYTLRPPATSALDRKMHIEQAKS